MRVQGTRISLEINFKSIQSRILGISEDEKVVLGNETIGQVDSFIYLGIIINKDGGCIEDVKSGIGMDHGSGKVCKPRLEYRCKRCKECRDVKCGSISLYSAIMREILKWLRNVLWMEVDRVPKIAFFGQPFRVKKKKNRPK